MLGDYLCGDSAPRRGGVNCHSSRTSEAVMLELAAMTPAYSTKPGVETRQSPGKPESPGRVICRKDQSR